MSVINLSWIDIEGRKTNWQIGTNYELYLVVNMKKKVGKSSILGLEKT